ncbi:hypothetical protein MHHB_P1172 [Methanofervidicoccus abyssi]|uniref:Uncharacterized protein n=2 Tax=Methanofervidicoccus abyssi TaxID=2082189 RepID=A0A401HRX2_9EURY|nr:hypothetical protein MHHB_P1172 [Methanofervidicoccus abyssi]
MRNNLLKLLLLITIILMPLQVYGEEPKIVKAWLGVYEYNGTYYDPLGNTFDGDNSYNGPDYIYTVIDYQLDNGDIIRQVIKLNDDDGTTDPAPTAVLSWTDPDGNTHTIFEQSGGNTYNVTSLPYTTEIPVGSQIKIIMNDNYNDDNYADGYWDIYISEDGINFSGAHQGGSYYHNLSFVLQNLNRNITWEVQMPYKNSGNEYYSGIIPFNGSEAIIYNISGDTPYAGQTLQYAPPTNFFVTPGGGLSIRAPIPIGAVIVSIIVMLFISYKRVE